MAGDSKWEVNIDPEQTKRDINQAIFEGIREVFELDIKPDAIEGSPYLTGTNRRSIETDTEQSADGKVTASIFTQSGYGGFLELGTVHMAAQPYLAPAFNKNIEKLGEVIGTKVEMIKPQMFNPQGGE